MDGRALVAVSSSRVASSTAFLSSLFDCILLLVKRSMLKMAAGSIDVDETRISEVVSAQVERMWKEITQDTLRVDTDSMGKAFANFFAGLQGVSVGTQ